MGNLSYETLHDRGGVPLRDYTQSGHSPSLLVNLKRNGWRDTLRRINFDSVGHTLVLASLGLGLLEILLPRRVQKMVGVRRGDHTGLIRMLGAREITSGLLTYSFDPPHRGMWARVLGDALDLALLSRVFTLRRASKGRAAAATAFIAGITAVDVLTAVQLRRLQAEQRAYSTLVHEDLSGARSGRAFRVVKSITIDRPVDELYAFWRDFENLPKFMYHLQEVRVIDDTHSHWVAKAPAGRTVEWNAVITDDQPNTLISWESEPGADVPNAGIVNFLPAPGNRGSIVRVEIEYRPPAGPIGRVIAMLFGEEPAQQVGGDLRRFKNVMETGEVIRSDGSPRGTGQVGHRPAQPLPEPKYEKLEHEIYKQQRELETMDEW